jgi:signal transduction histidine kinase
MREDADSPAKTQQLNAQTQRLASLGFMVASVCHEVSNPLAAVSSMLQILQSKRGVTPEGPRLDLRQHRARARHHQEARRLLARRRRAAGEDRDR